MLLQEIYDNSQLHKYVIFVDLDGVLVDFETTAKAITGIDLTDTQRGINSKKEFWKRVHAHAAAGKPFFAEMSPLPDAMHLWNYIKKYDPTILSATGKVHNAAQEKREWVRLHLGRHQAAKVIFVGEAASKQQYAAPNHILIDDREKAIGPWVAAGGLGILHMNAAQTIQELKKLGL